MKTSAVYIRVSDNRQEEYSPATQLKLAYQYAEKNGYYIPDEYIFQDDGISGKSANNRNEFNKMIAFAKQKEKPFEAIIVWKFSRFARNQEESIVYKNILKKKGISVLSISEPVIDGPFGELIERIIEWMDEYYLINLATEVRRGMTEKVVRGEPICAPAFGYKIENKCYYPNEDQVPIVKQVFSDYLNGVGVRAIATKLGNQGTRTRYGNMPDNRWVEYMLRNPVYIGKIRWCKNGNSVSRRDYDNPNIMITDGKHQPIIDNDTFNKVQEKIAEQKRKYAKYSRKNNGPINFALKGLCRCSNCNSTLVMMSSGKSIQCHSYARGACKVSHNISINKINAGVVDAMQKSIANLDFVIVPPDENQHQITTIVDYSKLLDIENKKLARAKIAYQEGVDTLEEYKDNKCKIQNNIDNIKKQEHADSKPHNFNKMDFAKKVKKVLLFIKNDRNSEKDKNEMLRTIITKIVFNRTNNHIDIYYYI